MQNEQGGRITGELQLKAIDFDNFYFAASNGNSDNFQHVSRFVRKLYTRCIRMLRCFFIIDAKYHFYPLLISDGKRVDNSFVKRVKIKHSAHDGDIGSM